MMQADGTAARAVAGSVGRRWRGRGGLDSGGRRADTTAGDPLTRPARTMTSIPSIPMTAAAVAPEETASPSAARRAGLGVPAIVWVLAASALLLRGAAVVAIADLGDPNAFEHPSLAVGLLAGNGFAFNEAGDYTERGVYEPSSVQSPPYPFFLAGLFALFGERAAGAYAVALGLNVLLGAAAVVATYPMVRHLAGRDAPVAGHAAGVVAAALMAISPIQVYSAVAAQAVAFIVLASVAVTSLWYASLGRGGLWPWVAYSLLGCFAALTEPVLLPAMALSGVWVLFTHALPGRLRLRNAAVLLAAAVVVIGPWTWRNYVVHERFVPIKASLWTNTWKGNNALDEGHSGTDRPVLTEARLAAYREHGTDALRQYDLLTPAQRIALDGADATERGELFGAWTREWISNNPGTYALVSIKRLAKTLWWDWDNPRGHQYLYAYPVWRALLLAGSTVGLWFAVRRRWRLGMPALIVGVALVTYSLTITAARFAAPLEPFQYALCGAAAVGLLGRRLAGGGSRPHMVERFLTQHRTPA